MRDDLQELVPELTHLDLAELLSASLTTELDRAMTRARVQQYQRYFADADRVLILLHNDPDPDALAAMRAGEKRTIVASGQAGYGRSGYTSPQKPGEKRFVIAPNTTVVYEIEVLDIKR